MCNNDQTTNIPDSPKAPIDNNDVKSQQTQDESHIESSRALAASLVSQCRNLLSEIDTLQSMLSRTLRNPQLVEVRSLRSSVLSELRMLEKLAGKIDAATAAANAGDDDGPEVRLLHALRSSNLPFYEAVWNIAKNTCTGLVAFGKRFYWDGGAGGVGEGGKGWTKKRPNQDIRKSVFVDIVADNGEEWVKVSTISETRLLFEMAKKGWEADSDDDDDDEGGKRTVLRNYNNDEDDSEDDDDDQVELIKLADDMRKAANATRIRYKHPRLRFVLPKIEEGQSPEIDDLLKVIRGYGIIVSCGGEMAKSQTVDGNEPKDAAAQEAKLAHLLPNPFTRFTPVLNVDCTLLLAAVSDLSHHKAVVLSPNHHSAIFRQVEVEKQRPLLPAELWPAMTGHELVCTTEAARRMQEIVDTIGTDAEKERAKLLMGYPPYNDCDVKSILRKFQELSDYEVPCDWRIPIKVVESKVVIATATNQGMLPPVSRQVAQILSDINYSVFMYGWVVGITTISSNRTVVKQIESTIEENRDSDENLEGPLVWVCDTARSLAGKDKDRKV